MNHALLLLTAIPCAVACSEPEDGANSDAPGGKTMTNESDAAAVAQEPGTAGAGTGPVRHFSFYVEPEHLQSAVEPAFQPSILVKDLDEGFDADLDGGGLDVELALISRRTGERVLVTQTFEAVTLPGRPPRDLRVRVKPEQGLEDGWYTFWIGVPDSWQPSGGTPEGPLGPAQRGEHYESLFRVGSQPTVLAVAACASKDDATLPKLRLTFSEPVLAPDPPPVTVTVDGRAVTCATYEPQDMRAAPYLGMTCTPAIPAAADVEVAIGGGLVAAAGGAAVTDAEGERELAVELPALASRYEGCRTWRAAGVGE